MESNGLSFDGITFVLFAFFVVSSLAGLAHAVSIGGPCSTHDAGELTSRRVSIWQSIDSEKEGCGRRSA
jgi:hypothetical protein